MQSGKQFTKKAPRQPGVYFFRDQRGKILYVGKAADIRSRLRSYFAEGSGLSPTKRLLVKEARRLTWQVTQGDIEALILEAQLIKKHRPRYNVVLRDDKNYFFVGFTKERLPRIFLTHQPKAETEAAYVGPFTEGAAVKVTLRLLRKIFPYATHEGFPKRCLEHDLGLCPIPPGMDELDTALVKRYRHTIRALKDVLQGKRQSLLRRLAREMKAAARVGDFANAAKRRDEIHGLERVFAHSRVFGGERGHYLEREDIPPPIRRLLGRRPLARIEGYDIANLAYGRAATGSMVVFTNGRPEKNAYRQFRIKTVRGASDIGMLREIIQRRFRNDWPLPDLMMIDGGKAQLNVALEVAAKSRWRTANSGKGKTKRPSTLRDMSFVIISLAKQNEEIYVPGLLEPLRLPKDHPFLLLLMHLRDEAHRFARRYHFHLRDRSLDTK